MSVDHGIPTEISDASQVRMVLVSTPPFAHLAAGTVAQHLGWSADEALARLCDAPQVLIETIEPVKGRRLAALLRALGLKIRLESAAKSDASVALSIQLAVPAQIERVVHAIAKQTGLSHDVVSQRLARPGGLILNGLTRNEADRLQSELGKFSSLSLTESDPIGAVYDVFVQGGEADESLTARLRLMGTEADPITGAVAVGLDQSLCDHLRKRLTVAEAVIIDRAFQRYDLYLVQVSGWVTRDLADFLVARTGLPRSGFDVLPERLPMRIEVGLTHAAARQFRADYASIGLETRLVLAGLVQSVDNPIL